jgi:hypothetical protein
VVGGRAEHEVQPGVDEERGAEVDARGDRDLAEEVEPAGEPGMVTGPPVIIPYPYRVKQPDRMEMIVNDTAKLEKPDMRRRSSWA